MDACESRRNHGEPPILSLVLMPYRSLSRRGFAIVMTLLGGGMLVLTTPFVAMGAWPILAFMGLVMAVTYTAFRLNFHAARASQEICVTRERLTMRDTSASGRWTEIEFDPYWARLEIARRPEQGIVAMRLASRGRGRAIAPFLPVPQREPVAAALKEALAEVRSTPG